MNNKEKRYSIKAVKLFLENEINPVIKENNLDIKFRVFTKDEYFSSDIYKFYCDDNCKEYADYLYFECNGFQLKDNIVMFLGKTNDEIEFGYNAEQIISLLSTAFHELAHHLQENPNQYDSYYDSYLDLIYFLIEKKVLYDCNNFYSNNWLNFFMEADADRFAFKAIMNRKEKYPLLYLDMEKYLEKKKDDIIVRIDTYDFNLIFNQFDLLDKDFSITNPTSKITSIIYKNGTNEFNSIEYIACQFKKLRFDELIYLVLGAESFLRTIKFNELNDNEINIMKDVVIKNCDECYSKLGVLKKFSTKYQQDVLKEKREMFEKRICQLNNILNKLNGLDNKKKKVRILN